MPINREAGMCFAFKDGAAVVYYLVAADRRRYDARQRRVVVGDARLLWVHNLAEGGGRTGEKELFFPFRAVPGLRAGGRRKAFVHLRSG